MFKKKLVNYCLLGVVAITGTACSTTESRRPMPIHEPLPVTPAPPKRNISVPQNTGVYAPPAFEEYKPQSTGPYASPEDTFESYVPEPEPEFESYTTPLEQAPPVVVERLSPAPVAKVEPPKPVVEPVKPVVEDFSKNELDIDPFAEVPDRETLAVTSNNASAKPAPRNTTQSLSVAANALLIGAKADAALGRYDSAITKVERALRIEPNSPLLWYQLGNFNYGKGRYDQAISLSRKSLGMSTGNRSLVSQNLDLMSKAATKTGNTKVFKEVLDYKRMNP